MTVTFPEVKSCPKQSSCMRPNVVGIQADRVIEFAICQAKTMQLVGRAFKFFGFVMN